MTEQTNPDIIYTIVDEAPELASASFLPIISAFANAAGVSVGTKDISLAGRIIAAFPERLTDAQRQSDDLAELGELVKTPEANVIKLPNISASVPQLVAAIKELLSQGYVLPDYPEEPATDAEKDARARYDSIKGSAVNPVRLDELLRTVVLPVSNELTLVQSLGGIPIVFDPSLDEDKWSRRWLSTLQFARSEVDLQEYLKASLQSTNEESRDSELGAGNEAAWQMEFVAALS